MGTGGDKSPPTSGLRGTSNTLVPLNFLVTIFRTGLYEICMKPTRRIVMHQCCIFDCFDALVILWTLILHRDWLYAAVIGIIIVLQKIPECTKTRPCEKKNKTPKFVWSLVPGGKAVGNI